MSDDVTPPEHQGATRDALRRQIRLAKAAKWAFVGVLFDGLLVAAFFGRILGSFHWAREVAVSIACLAFPASLLVSVLVRSWARSAKERATDPEVKRRLEEAERSLQTDLKKAGKLFLFFAALFIAGLTLLVYQARNM